MTDDDRDGRRTTNDDGRRRTATTGVANGRPHPDFPHRCRGRQCESLGPGHIQDAFETRPGCVRNPSVPSVDGSHVN
jgi:hypothetical protein